MTNYLKSGFALLSLFLFSLTGTSQNVITTIVGNGTNGTSGDGGLATAAQISNPQAIAYDASGNLIVAEYSHIRKVDAVTGIITAIAGNTPWAGYTGDGGPATSASISPFNLAVAANGDIYFCQGQNGHAIRKIEFSTGIITTIYGNGVAGFTGDGGPATAAQFSNPRDLFFDPAGNLYIADNGNHRIRKIDAGTGIITTIAGNGINGATGDGGLATVARVGYPQHLSMDVNGHIYICSSGNNVVRKIDGNTGIITKVAGFLSAAPYGDGGPATSASMNAPSGAVADASGNLFITDRGNHAIRYVDYSTGIISTIAGTNTGGYNGDGIDPTTAQIKGPWNAKLSPTGDVEFVDAQNFRVRRFPAPAAGPATFTIPDANFAAFLNANFPSIMSGNDLDIAGANAVTAVINCESLNISDLSGIEYFTSITHLYCGFNNLTTLDVSALNLTLLRAQHNDLAVINGLASQSNLTYFWANANELTDLSDIVNLTQMWSLQIGNNQLSSLPSLSNFSSLVECSVGLNPDPATDLDVSNNTVLRSLACGSLNLTSITGLQNTQLSYLDCRINNITDLSDLQAIPTLRTIWARNNLLTSFPPLNSWPDLEHLQLANNQLASGTLDVSGNPSLLHFECGNTNLSSVTGLLNTPLLRTFSASSNNLTDVSDLASLSNLSKVYVYHNQLTSFPTLVSPSLQYLYIYRNPMNNWTLDLSNNINLWFLDFSETNADAVIGLATATNLRQFTADINNLTTIDGIENATNLVNMNITLNEITSLPDLSGLTSMTAIAMKDNRLDFSDAREMRIINDLPSLTTFNYDRQQPFAVIATSVGGCTGEAFEIAIAPQDSAIAYQWYLDGSPIAGATSATYSLASFDAVLNSGVYTVESQGTALLYPAPMDFPGGVSFFTSEPVNVFDDPTACTIDTSGNPCENGKVEICHVPPGNPANAHTICVSPNAVAAHLAHGDYYGPCNGSGSPNLTNPNVTLSASPNPFSGQTTIEYYLPQDADVQIQISDVHGSIVETTSNTFTAAGNHTIIFNPPYNGVFIIVMTIDGSEVITTRVVAIH